MTPEARARLTIGKQLPAAGWHMQDLSTANLGAAPGGAVCEYPTGAGRADYLLFVDRRTLGAAAEHAAATG